jgi:hypothetical protein
VLGDLGLQVVAAIDDHHGYDVSIPLEQIRIAGDVDLDDLQVVLSLEAI